MPCANTAQMHRASWKSPEGKGFLSSSKNERKMSIMTKSIIRGKKRGGGKKSFLKSITKKFAFYSQPLSTERTAYSEDLQDAKFHRLLQPRLCVQPAEDCLM